MFNEAQNHYQICRNRLAGNELYIAKFYYKNKAYGAAINRLEEILAVYFHFKKKDVPTYGIAYKLNWLQIARLSEKKNNGTRNKGSSPVDFSDIGTPYIRSVIKTNDDNLLTI